MRGSDLTTELDTTGQQSSTASGVEVKKKYLSRRTSLDSVGDYLPTTAAN